LLQGGIADKDHLIAMLEARLDGGSADKGIGGSGDTGHATTEGENCEELIGPRRSASRQ